MNLFQFGSLVFVVFFNTYVWGQEHVYKLDVSQVRGSVAKTALGFHGSNSKGTTLSVNNQYFIRNGEPWFPLMGEFHYIRYPENYWEEELLKMKSAGLQLVATYIFWNAHETSRGHWEWEGRKDLRRFVSLCAKHGLYVWLRVGPWSHGEQRYGGHPDWINTMEGKRSNDPIYLRETKRLFAQIASQVRGMWFADNGPIIGVQLENEYASGDPQHIAALKKIAIETGMDPVYYSVTANTLFNDDLAEVIPLQGAYPYRGWEKGGGGATKDFLYGNDQWIMTDALGKVYYDIAKYPKGLCEQGCGSQMTYRNRFVVEPHVVEAHLQNQIGRGMNMIGYYMFHGGTQLAGLEEPGYPISYDFQAPIGEFGQLRPSFAYLKTLHHFVNSFGKDLAKMSVAEPLDPVRDELDTAHLRYIARTDGQRGFVFLGNTQVRVPMPDKHFRFQVKLDSEVIDFPEMTLLGQTNAILPFNFDLNGITLSYATAQPLTVLTVQGKPHYVFYRVNGMDPEFAFRRKSLGKVGGEHWVKEMSDDRIIVRPENEGTRMLEITAEDGKEAVVILLTRAEAEQAWIWDSDGQKRLLISSANLIFTDQMVRCDSWGNNEIVLNVFPGMVTTALKVSEGDVYATNEDELFQHIKIRLPAEFPRPKIVHQSATDREVSLTTALPNHLSDLFMSVDYVGGMARLCHKGDTLTDNLYNGIPWDIGLKRYLIGRPLNLQVKVAPWTNDITGLHGIDRSKPPLVNDIRFVPVYTAVINTGG